MPHIYAAHPKEIEEIIYNYMVNPAPEHDHKLLLAKNKLYL